LSGESVTRRAKILYNVQYIKKQDKPTKKRLEKALFTLAENPYQRDTLDISSLQGLDGAFCLAKKLGGLD